MGSIPIFGIFIIILMFFLINFISSTRPRAWQLGFQYPATAIMEGIINFHHDLFFFIIIIIVFTYYMLVRCVILYKNTKNNKKRVPINIIHAPILEIIWTLIPAFILFLIALPSFSLLYSMDEMEESFTTVKVIGNQWYWTYELEDPNYCIPIFYNREQEILATDNPTLMYHKMKYCRIAFEQYWQKNYKKNESTFQEKDVLVDPAFIEMLFEKREKLLHFKVITKEECPILFKKQLAKIAADKAKINNLEEFYYQQLKQSPDFDTRVKARQLRVKMDEKYNEECNKKAYALILEKEADKFFDADKSRGKAEIPNMFKIPLPKEAEEFRRFVEDEIEHKNFFTKHFGRLSRKILHIVEIINQKIDIVLHYFGLMDHKKTKFSNIRTTFDSYMIPTEDLVKRHLRLLDVDNKLFLPTGINIKIIITSSDVLHSWAVPSFGIKLDSVPGRLNQTSLKLRYGGFFYGQCSEICGINHAFMPIVVGGVPCLPNKFKIEMSQEFFNTIYPIFMNIFYKHRDNF